MTPASERYQTDPIFHAIVDLLRFEMRLGDFTPTELREAVMLATTMHESETVRPITLTCGECRVLGIDPEDPRR